MASIAGAECERRFDNGFEIAMMPAMSSMFPPKRHLSRLTNAG